MTEVRYIGNYIEVIYELFWRCNKKGHANFWGI